MRKVARTGLVAAANLTPQHAQDFMPLSFYTLLALVRESKAAGDPVWEMPTVDPVYLADLLWTMHSTRDQPEARYSGR